MRWPWTPSEEAQKIVASIDRGGWMSGGSVFIASGGLTISVRSGYDDYLVEINGVRIPISPDSRAIARAVNRACRRDAEAQVTKLMGWAAKEVG